MLDREEIERNKKELRPGSPEAIAQGCRCSAESNCEGKGFKGDSSTWAIETSCKLHYWDSMRVIAKKKRKTEDEE